ncbi:ABC transporter substrate-binding protein [Mumia sp. zg.B53]|uniref:ABC transporter substrate-binding protein n=1 Tax=unclassified Mumia TaxID=2621872 RepID=UPI001C6ECF2A|nr:MULTISPECIES: ABC transporter substrate-binding protein [unclassified Mumia]MBW9209533.1 ABC transporter substrate-binding protein [Mumia sp. zg.B21]MBW9214138.1 ABC transporter substrate-binding protein [Mumia sp. zg.B53]
MKSTTLRRLRRSAAALVCAAALVSLSACGDDDNGGGDGSQGSVTLSGQNFTEMQILAELYTQVLENEGYDVTQKLVDTRDIYMAQLADNKVQVVPEYLSGIGDYLNDQANGAGSTPVTSNNVEDSLDKVSVLAEGAGVTLLEPAEATDQNAYAVTKEFADKNSVTTLSDLAATKQPIKLAAAPDCKDRQDCAKGLKEVYGIDITEVLPLGFGTREGKDAAANGEVQLVQVATTDGSLEDDGLVLLEDDKGLQPAQNLIPAVNTTWLADNKGAADALNELSAQLTTDKLADLNTAVDVDREKPADVAKKFLEDEGLLG